MPVFTSRKGYASQMLERQRACSQTPVEVPLSSLEFFFSSVMSHIKKCSTFTVPLFLQKLIICEEGKKKGEREGSESEEGWAK